MNSQLPHAIAARKKAAFNRGVCDVIRRRLDLPYYVCDEIILQQTKGTITRAFAELSIAKDDFIQECKKALFGNHKKPFKKTSWSDTQ